MDFNSTESVATDDVPEIKPWIRIFGASSYLIMATISLAMNLTLLSVLIRGHKQFKTMSFFIIAWQMLINDLMSLSLQFILAIPITFAGHAIYLPLFTQIVATIDTLCYNGLLMFCFLMTLNRFLVFMWPALNEIMFTRPRIYRVIIIGWLLVIGHTTALNLCGCWKTYNTEEFYIQYTCKEMHSFMEVFFSTLDLAASTYLPPFMLVLYVLIFLEIKFNLSYVVRSCRMMETTVTQSRREISMLVQSVIICVVFELENLAFIYVPQIPAQGDLRPFMTFLLSWSNILLNTIHSIVIFSFNSMARAKLRELFFDSKSNIVLPKSLTDSTPIQKTSPRRTLSVRSSVNVVLHH